MKTPNKSETSWINFTTVVHTKEKFLNEWCLNIGNTSKLEPEYGLTVMCKFSPQKLEPTGFSVTKTGTTTMRKNEIDIEEGIPGLNIQLTSVHLKFLLFAIKRLSLPSLFNWISNLIIWSWRYKISQNIMIKGCNWFLILKCIHGKKWKTSYNNLRKPRKHLKIYFLHIQILTSL